MALKRTKLLNIQSVTGIATVGIFTVGVTQTAGGVGIASTTYLRSVIMHNTGLSTCTVSLYINPNTFPVISGYGITSNRIIKIDLSSNETYFFETNYPIVLTDRDAISVSIDGTPTTSGIGSVVNFVVNGDTDII
jgi:hypothetical protein